MVACSPSKSPAKPSNIEPVQTAVTVSASAARARNQSSMIGFFNAFLVQWGIGLVINLWPVEGGRYAAAGYAIK